MPPLTAVAVLETDDDHPMTFEASPPAAVAVLC
jgi:hypothetical protein